MEDNLVPLETSDNDRIIQVNIEEQMEKTVVRKAVGEECPRFTDE